MSLLPEGEAKRKRERSYRCRAEKSFQKDMLRDYTYRYNTLERRQSSSRRERQRIEIVRSSADRSTMLGEVSMLAAQENSTGSQRHRSHVKARATVH